MKDSILGLSLSAMLASTLTNKMEASSALHFDQGPCVCFCCCDVAINGGERLLVHRFIPVAGAPRH